jgi:uncharacterized Fe-S cluster protein YjdI
MMYDGNSTLCLNSRKLIKGSSALFSKKTKMVSEAADAAKEMPAI